MCSIAGCFAPKISQDDFLKLNQKMKVRGPDHSGFVKTSMKGKNLYLAHNRLSILDLSPSGNQPMENERFIIVFNGEIYNHNKIRKTCKQELTSTSDTQSILCSFTQNGIKKTLSKLNGMFAIALFDKHEQKLYLMRDRMGVKPLYYTHKKGEFAFASTTAGISSHLKGKVNDDAIVSFVSLGYIPASHSYYDGVYKLAQASYLVFDGESVQIKPYWQTPTMVDEKISHDNIAVTLEKAVKGRLIADVSVGALLSGGVDSSLVCAIASKYTKEPLKTFGLSFDYKDYDEGMYAKKIAKILGTNHRQIKMGVNDLRKTIKRHYETFDEPFGDASSLALIFLLEFVKDKVKVVLSGDGGDELFLGYERYNFVQKYHKKFSHIPSFVRKPLALGLKYSSNDRLEKLSFAFNKPSIENLYALTSTAIKPWELDKVFSKDFLDTQLNYLDLARIKYKIRKKHLLWDLSYIDQMRYLCDDILVKVDRISMAYSLEARTPLLDYKLVELANKLPLGMRKNKQILKTMLEQYLPKSLIYRPKKGFSVPLKHWFRNELKEEIYDSVSSLDERFNKPKIKRLLDLHMSGAKNYEYLLWNLLQLSHIKP